MKVPRISVLVVMCVVNGYRTCPKNCKIVRKQSTCDTVSRLCLNGCNEGRYGDTCEKSCSHLCRNRTCQQRNGICSCVHGYKFDAGSCVINKGVACSSNKDCLDNTCISSGREECLKGCNPGRFGSFCKENCRGHCVCDQISENCTECMKGWYGPECASRCSSGCKKIRCQVNGSCVEGCKSETFGDQCDKKCVRNCFSGCYRMSGDCVQCTAGWFGSTCQVKCSNGCADCDRAGICRGGCINGFYGGKCEFRCPTQCDGDACYPNGTCSACKIGFYRPSCNNHCHTCKDGICNQMTGACSRGCVKGFYGGHCNLTCESCTDDNCDDKCTSTREDQSWMQTVQYSVGGAVVIIIIFAAILVYICCRLKRIHNVVKWRRQPPDGHLRAAVASQVSVEDYSEPPEQVDMHPPRVCPMLSIRQTSYLDPRNSDGTGNNNAQPQQQLCSIVVSDQQVDEPQAAAALHVNFPRSDRLPHDPLRSSDELSGRAVSYLLPNYSEVNEELMDTLPQPMQGVGAPAPVSKNSPFPAVADVHVQSEHPDVGEATGGDIRIPLIAECFGNTETEESSSGEDYRPDCENYDHPFRDHYA